jgi:malate dehydrogenase (oxaloacetate-decarboxylating)(NADP+)
LVARQGDLRQREPVPVGGSSRQDFRRGQGNNVYIVPAMGIAVYATEAMRVTEEMFIIAARAVAEQITDQCLAAG